MEYVRIDWPEPDEPRQARRCTTRDCDYTPRVEGECWLCPHCVEKRRREREALREALAGLLAGLQKGLAAHTPEWQERLRAARMALGRAEGD
jgi:uncharacterized paraquat-inducible protein A